MTIEDAFNEIIHYTHWRNWAPDWQIAKEVYKTFPKSYSVLSPFAYSYLEELIRSTTSEYGREIFDENGSLVTNRTVGMKLIKLAIAENGDKKEDLIRLLENIKTYYYSSQETDEGNNRHSVAHGYMHPRFWSQESFEKLLLDIAELSKYAEF